MWSPRPLARDRRTPPGFIEPCQPVLRDTAPSGPEWLHEIKHDGYRLIARKDGDRVRLWSRQGRPLTGKAVEVTSAVRKAAPWIAWSWMASCSVVLTRTGSPTSTLCNRPPD